MHFNILKKGMKSLTLFGMFLLLSMIFLKTSVYAAVPYTYTAITGNTIEVTFDYAISGNNSSIPVDKIAVYQTSGSTAMRPLKISSSIDDGDRKILDITIGELDSDVLNYAVKIDKDALTFDGYIPLTNFTLPFSTTDFAMGFKTIFMNQPTQTTTDIINKILTYNTTRDISIYVPKQYITSIETIHKKQGLTATTTTTTPTTPATTTTTTTTTATATGTTTITITPTTTTTTFTPNYTKLTNIDVKTDSAVKRLKVSIGTLSGRDLFLNSNFTGFTTGQAGLDIDTTGTDYTITIMAFDINGKLLENSSYFKKVADVKTELVSDYVTKASTSAGKTITLYDLMKTPATLTSMIQSVKDDTLDLIKVVYPNTSDTRVISNIQGESNDAANMLAEALSDNSVQYIKFVSALPITLSQAMTLARTGNERNIVLDGNGSTITGNVTIGSGSSDTNKYELRNVTINGDLSETGENCILTNVIVKGSTIVSNKNSATVTDVAIIDEALKADKSLFGIADVIKIGVKFSEPVFVVGNPKLNLGGVNAIYDEVSTQDATINPKHDIVVFKYIVQESDNIVSIATGSTAIDLTTGDIQARVGASATSVDGTKANSKTIYSSISKNKIVADGVRPSLSTTNPISATTSAIVYVASKQLDKASAEVAGNWIIRIVDASTPNGFTDVVPLRAFLQGDNKTVIIDMPISLTAANIVAINTTHNVASVFMTNAVKDKAGNGASDMVVQAAGSLGTAWHNSIVGLDSTKGYIVIAGTGDSAQSNVKMVSGLKNGETYKVVDVTAANNTVATYEALPLTTVGEVQIAVAYDLTATNATIANATAAGVTDTYTGRLTTKTTAIGTENEKITALTTEIVTAKAALTALTVDNTETPTAGTITTANKAAFQTVIDNATIASVTDATTIAIVVSTTTTLTAGPTKN
ncbi:hypothetical protein [Clostridium sp.]|uniref:hypothetical protein n=1 Tax=Clostridium sp. TaxID=1506 RepID=UPI003D6D5FC2